MDLNTTRDVATDQNFEALWAAIRLLKPATASSDATPPQPTTPSALPSDATPADIGVAGVAGNLPDYSRSDHTHKGVRSLAAGTNITLGGTATDVIVNSSGSGGGGETPVADVNYTALSTDRVIVYTSLTATRTVTLPPANSVAAGTELTILDGSGSASASINIIAARAGADTINGGTSIFACSATYNGNKYISDGTSKWFCILGTNAIQSLQIADGTITNTDLVAMANRTYKGNISGALQQPADLTSAQVTADLDLVTSTLRGLAPLSGGGTTNFLRADATWAAPAGGSSSGVLANNPGLLFAQVSVAAGDTISNTLVATAFVAGWTIPANTLAVGQTIEINLSGVYGTIGAAPGNITLTIKFGSTTIVATSTVILTAGQTNRGWALRAFVTINTIVTTTCTVEAQGMVGISVGSSGATVQDLANTATKTFDSTAAQAVTVVVAFSALGALNTITCREFTASLVGGGYAPRKGADIASANNLVLGADGNTFGVTGTTQINLIDTSLFVTGMTLILKFAGALTVKHNQTVSGSNKPILLRGAVDYVTAAGSMLELWYDGTNWNDYRVGLASAPSGTAGGDLTGTYPNPTVAGVVAATKVINEAKGANIASANNLVLGADGNTFHITGTTQVNLIASTNMQAGSKVRLIFDGILTVKSNQTVSGVNKPVLLLHGADYRTQVGYCLDLVYDGTNWIDSRIGQTALLYTRASGSVDTLTFNNTTENIFASGWTIPANTLLAGMVIKTRISGIHTMGTASAVALKFKFGSVILWQTATPNFALCTSTFWCIELTTTIITTGATGTVSCDAVVMRTTSASVPGLIYCPNPTFTSTIDTTGAIAVTASVTTSTAGADVFTVQQWDSFIV